MFLTHLPRPAARGVRRAESEPCAACSTASAAAAAALPAPLRAERGVVVLPPPVGARRGEERRGDEGTGGERRRGEGRGEEKRGEEIDWASRFD